MDNDERNREREAQGSYQGYDAPGADVVVESGSSAVPSPSQTSEERLTTPKPVIESINETPGDANPALVETIGVAEGQLSTADMLRTREAAEEQQLRAVGAEAYADQPPGMQPAESQDQDTGRPTVVEEELRPPAEVMDAPHAAQPFLTPAGVRPEFDAPRADAWMDRDRSEAASNQTRSALDPVSESVRDEGFNYEEREFGRPGPQSDLDRLARDTVNLPPETKDEDD